MSFDFIKSEVVTHYIIDISIIFFIVFLIYFSSLMIIKMIGHTSVKQFSPTDLISLFIFGGLVENAVSYYFSERPLILMIGAFFILFLNSFLSRTYFFRRFFLENRIVLVQQGVILDENLKKSGVSESELWTALRNKEVINLIQVKEAALENNGGISVIKTHVSMTDPVTGLPYSWSEMHDWVVRLFNAGTLEVTCVYVDLKYTQQHNKEYGSGYTNRLLKKIAEIAVRSFRMDDKVYRFDGDKILAILNTGEPLNEKPLKRFTQNLKQEGITYKDCLILKGEIHSLDELDNIPDKLVPVPYFFNAKRGRK